MGIVYWLLAKLMPGLNPTQSTVENCEEKMPQKFSFKRCHHLTPIHKNLKGGNAISFERLNIFQIVLFQSQNTLYYTHSDDIRFVFSFVTNIICFIRDECFLYSVLCRCLFLRVCVYVCVVTHGRRPTTLLPLGVDKTRLTHRPALTPSYSCADL